VRNLSIKLYRIYECYTNIMLYDVIYAVRYYPQFSETAVGLGTYYLWIWRSTCMCVGTYAYMHAYLRTYVHTYIHTYILLIIEHNRDVSPENHFPFLWNWTHFYFGVWIVILPCIPCWDTGQRTSRHPCKGSSFEPWPPNLLQQNSQKRSEKWNRKNKCRKVAKCLEPNYQGQHH
jgi:hypothetical protein